MERKFGKRFQQQAHVLMIHIHSLCQRKAGKCIATTKYLASLIDKSERQTYYYLKYLKDTKQIEIVTSEVKRNKNHKIKLLFYQNRTIQSYHIEPEGYKAVNDAHFNKNHKEIKDMSAKFTLNHKLNSTLIDKNGAPLPPMRVGKVTNEYLAENLKLVKLEKPEKIVEKHYIPKKPEIVGEVISPEVIEAYKYILTPKKLSEESLLKLVEHINAKKPSERTKEDKDLIIFFLKSVDPDTNPCWSEEVKTEVTFSTPDIDLGEDDEPAEGDELAWFKRQKKEEPVKEPEPENTQFKLTIDLNLRPWWTPRHASRPRRPP